MGVGASLAHYSKYFELASKPEKPVEILSTGRKPLSQGTEEQPVDDKHYNPLVYLSQQIQRQILNLISYVTALSPAIFCFCTSAPHQNPGKLYNLLNPSKWRAKFLIISFKIKDGISSESKNWPFTINVTSFPRVYPMEQNTTVI